MSNIAPPASPPTQRPSSCFPSPIPLKGCSPRCSSTLVYHQFSSRVGVSSHQGHTKQSRCGSTYHSQNMIPSIIFFLPSLFFSINFLCVFNFGVGFFFFFIPKFLLPGFGICLVHCKKTFFTSPYIVKETVFQE